MPRWLTVLPALAACSRPVVAPPIEAAPIPVTPAEPPAPPAPRVTPDQIVTDVFDRATLTALEAEGYGWTALLGAPRVDALYALWREDVAAVIGRVKRPLVTVLADALAWPAGNVGRAFDLRWLGSPSARFELVAVVNRVDRLDLSPGTCGEVRLIYRLAYTEQGLGSRLPFLVNVVLDWPAGDCAAVARRWVKADGDAAAWLRAGPLAGARLARVEVNAQVVRFPSGVETEFAGQAAYLLRVYTVAGEGLLRAPLENTPDVDRLRADPALRDRLLAAVSAQLPQVDLGVHELPDELLTTEALSWSTLGANRRANKPFDALFPLGSRDSLPAPPPEAGLITSRDGLVERLNNSTCMGCHQAGSMAGFHVLGLDDPARTGITNRLRVPFSPHFAAERPRRAAYVAALANGLEPDRRRPHSIDHGGGANAPCLADGDDLRLRLGCPDGRTCEVVAHDAAAGVQFGQCVARDVAALGVGETCRAATISGKLAGPGAPFNTTSYADTAVVRPLYPLPEDKRFDTAHVNCRPTVIGVPLGRTYRSCTPDERALRWLTETSPLPPSICGLVGGSSFDRCVEQDFHRCLDDVVSRGMVAACDPTHPCREDYVCQAFPASLPGLEAEAALLDRREIGFCTPTYFLFQIRLDGHPVPRVGP
jgi:hypothetical protein